MPGGRRRSPETSSTVGKALAKLSGVRPDSVQTGGRLDVRLFGHVEVALNGARFKLATPRKSLQVLAYLLLHRGAAVAREYLAYLLYPDDEEASARAKPAVDQERAMIRAVINASRSRTLQSSFLIFL